MNLGPKLETFCITCQKVQENSYYGQHDILMLLFNLMSMQITFALVFQAQHQLFCCPFQIKIACLHNMVIPLTKIDYAKINFSCV